jgi:ABC-type Fe3+-siderophore transport system permease subunit
MTWLKNNLWTVILGALSVAQVTLITLQGIGVIQWHRVLVMLPFLILVGMALFLVGCVVFLDLDEEED